MKTASPLCLPLVLAVVCLGGAHAQEALPLPSGSGQPSAVSPPVAAPTSLADEAQRKLFEAAAAAANEAVQNKPVKSGPRKTSFPSPVYNEPVTWKKDSIHKLAVMEVSLGGTDSTVMIELFSNDAPQTVVNFIENCESGSYNGLAFHRAIEGFIVQTGDPLSADEGARDRWGTGGESKTVPAEIKRTHRKGAVAMGRRSDAVNSSRRSNGYQFYIALGNYASLDGKYTVFGQVVSGLDVLERVSKMPVDSNDCPLARIEVKSIKVIDHKGPLIAAPADPSSGRKYSKPAAAKGFMERFLERIW